MRAQKRQTTQELETEFVWNSLCLQDVWPALHLEGPLAGVLPAARKGSGSAPAADVLLTIPLLSPTGTDEGPTSPAGPVQPAGGPQTGVPALPHSPQPSSRGATSALGGSGASSEPADERAAAATVDPKP